MIKLPNDVVSNASNIFLSALPSYVDPDITNVLLALLAEISSYFHLEILKEYALILLNCLLSGLSDSLLVVASIAWAIIQHQLVCRLTSVPYEIQWNFRSFKFKPSISGSMIIVRFLWNWASHQTMYIRSRLPGEESVLQLVIISSLPLAIPYGFYSKWPVLSTVCLMCWGHLWLKDIYLGLICTVLFPRSSYDANTNSCFRFSASRVINFAFIDDSPAIVLY